MFHDTVLIGSFNATNDTLTVTAAQSGGSNIRFVNTTAAGVQGTLFVQDILGSINCFAAGTRIAAMGEEIAVEDLKPGDKILTDDGGVTEVKWVGVQTVISNVLHPQKINPICISAGAIAENVPSRDLHVTPDHAVAIDGLLINASALVNGHTIYQVRDMPAEGFTYYHVETEAHELILAEGCPAESYLDVPDRSAFDNGAERADAPQIEEMDLPRVSSARLVPQYIRDQLARRVQPTELCLPAA